jgi:hypothetical protein
MTRTLVMAVALAAVLGVSAVVTGQVGHVTICHIPPGNPDMAHTITVGQPAVQNHTAHGDTMGACAGDQAQSPGNPDKPGSGNDQGSNPDQPQGPTPSAVAELPTYWLGLLLVVLAGIAIGTVAALRRRQRNR